ncbi:MAG: response regulator [bacterium]
MGTAHGLNMASNLRILLVDDERSYIEVLSYGLTEEYNYQTTLAMSGEEAIKILGDEIQVFDVILLDYRMPEMNGLEVLEWIIARNISIPVVMLTGAGSEIIAVEAMKLGAYDYARKESTDILMLHNLIEATHERYVYRVSKKDEEERVQKEILLNREATDSVQQAINIVTPVLNTAFAHLAAIYESTHSKQQQGSDRGSSSETDRILEVEEATKALEIGMRSFLELSQHLYARHEDIGEIKRVMNEFEARIKELKARL